ncbi:hypothetical protein [Cesiribacter andamanensis]|uniref:ABC transporter ATPase n=1 Tax=Cesiribacter andamanensis AMV16 TaxID=1279009 RepID=M7NMY1_9BACT|nr:hypothetical protein [Cesiribacter andamanensis]EMR03110.1 hypothetical protein ADICEAN_01769 [Cesiribacter andamanensis AMV16]
MYIPYPQLPAASRVWIYAAPRPFNQAELQHIEATAPAFLDDWATHGSPMQASYHILQGQFLVLAVNEAVQAASGCSIDSSMGYIRSLEQQFSLSLTDRSQVYVLQEGRVQAIPVAALKQRIADGALTPESLLLNTLAATKGALEQHWQQAAGQSWLKRYFKKALA